MNKLGSKIRGVLLDRPPRTEVEKAFARWMGIVQLPSGQWMLPDPAVSPPLEVIREYPHGHKCKACKSSFRSQRARDRYCPSCRAIMERQKSQLEEILRGALEAPEREQRAAWETVENELICPVPGCGWQGNQGRSEPSDIPEMLTSLGKLVAAAHCHFMRHAFWNRFPYTRRFAPKLRAEEKDFYYSSDWLRELERCQFSLEIEPLADIEFVANSEAEIPLSVEDAQGLDQEQDEP